MTFSLGHKIFLFVLGSLLAILCSCDSSGRSHGADSITRPQQSATSKKFSGMRIVKPGEGRIALGTNDTLAPAKERPSMKVELTYDFYMGQAEITRREYKMMMDSVEVPAKWNQKRKFTLDSLNYPVTNVTYYDAVLYVNARSKFEKYDTAYTYKSATFNEEGNCTGLEGLVFHPELDAYRLPTEAEWVLVASMRWNPEKGWNAENSGHGLHLVCTADEVSELDSAARDSAFCDMAGNALEWVNDWMGAFVDSVVVNYVGGSDGGSIGEKVVKGGSYNDKPKGMKIYNRGDIYTVTGSSRADYVGFRVAYGKIPDALWVNGDGSLTSSRVNVLTKASTLGTVLGTSKAKLAFRNDLTGNLTYVDFAIGGTSAVEIRDTLTVYHPEISPNGKLVAFCTGLEGIDGKSQVYVRHLNPSGSNLVKLNAESAAIPRWRVLENGDTVIVYVTSAGNNKDDASFKSQSTWQVKFANNRFGTPQKLFDGAYHDGVSKDGRLAVTGARLLRARVVPSGSADAGDALDTVWYGGEQACNASLSRDNSKRTLFLDFGGKTGKEFAGTDYGTHEMLLVVDSTGTLVRGIPAPAGTSFDHAEWVARSDNSPKLSSDVAVVTLVNGEGAHSKIALLNLADSALLEVASGMELWHPNMWVYGSSDAERNSVSADSAGVYYDPEGGYEYATSAVELASKMSKFWSVYKDVEYVAFGSSMTLNALIDDSVKTYKTLNMSYTLGDVFGAIYLLKNYVLPYASSLKVVSMELTPGFLFHLEEDMWEDLYDNSPGFAYDEKHLDAQFDAIVKSATEQEFTKDMFSSSYIEGTYLLPSAGWKEPTYIDDIAWMYTTNSHFKVDFETFKGLKKNMETLGIKFFVNITPRSPMYRETEAYDYFGPRWAVAESIISMFKESGFIVFDEYRMGEHDYTDDMAFNATHLSELGARQYTARLDSVLTKLDSLRAELDAKK